MKYNMVWRVLNNDVFWVHHDGGGGDRLTDKERNLNTPGSPKAFPSWTGGCLKTVSHYTMVAERQTDRDGETGRDIDRERQTGSQTDIQKQTHLEAPKLSLHGLAGVDDGVPVHHDGSGVEVRTVHIEGRCNWHCRTEKRQYSTPLAQSAA